MKPKKKVVEAVATSGCTSFLRGRRDGWWWELWLECGHRAERTKGAKRHLDSSKDKEPPKFVFCEYCKEI